MRNPNGECTRALGRGEAGRAVLEHQDLGRINPEARGGRQVNLGVGLAAGDILGG